MIIALLLFWFIISGNFSEFFIVAAIFSVCIVIFIDQRLFSKISLKLSLQHLLNFISLLKEMLSSGLYVAKIILFNRNIIAESNWVDISEVSDFAQVNRANAITLTPGTMSMKIKNDQILVHSIKAESLK